MDTRQLADALNAEFWHTGGGIMAAVVERGRYRFYFGIESGSPEYLVWDIDRDNDSWRTGYAPDAENWNKTQIVAKAHRVMATLEGELA